MSRVVAYLGKIARQRGLDYPVPSAHEIASLLGDQRLQIGEYVITADDIVEALPSEMFPLVHEGEFLSATHLGLQRCRVQTIERWQRLVSEHNEPNR